MKVRMTKQRKEILAKLCHAPLSWGYGEQGGKEYFFNDGSAAKASVVEGMINSGLLKTEIGPLGGDGQEIRAAQ